MAGQVEFGGEPFSALLEQLDESAPDVAEADESEIGLHLGQRVDQFTDAIEGADEMLGV